MAEQHPQAHSVSPTGTFRRHRRIEGILPLPTASGEVRLIRLHDAFEQEEFEGTATEFGKAPSVPAWNDVDSNRVFVGGERICSSPAVAANLTGHTWQLQFHYTYILATAEGLASEMPGAKIAEDSLITELKNANYPATCFTVGLMGQPSPQ